MKSLLDPNFRYVPAAATDIRKTFARVRDELAQAESYEGDGRYAHLPESADACEFGQIEYDWRLREAGL